MRYGTALRESGAEGTRGTRRDEQGDTPSFVIHALIVLVVFLVALGGVAPPSWAQAVRQLETGFERDVNRYRWRYGLQVAHQVGAWQFALDNRFRSDAFILFDDRYSFRDENRLAWRVNRTLPGAFSLRSRGTVAWFSQSLPGSSRRWALRGISAPGSPRRPERIRRSDSMPVLRTGFASR